MTLAFVRSPYNYDRNAASRASGVECLDESLAIQSAKEECDINTIVRRFGVTGQLPQDVRRPTYGDFTEVVDFRQAQDALIAARESFMAMPAEVRKRFHNDAAEFVDFCSDEKNLDEMRKLGLAVPKVVKVDSPPMKVEIVNPVKENGDGSSSG